MAKRKNNNYRKRLLVIILGLLLLGVFFILKIRPKDNIKGITDSSDVKVYFNSGTNTILTTKTVKLYFDAAKSISFANVEFNFDPARLAIVGDIVVSDKFKLVVHKTSTAEANADGNVSIAAAVSINDKATMPTGLINFATFTLSNKYPSLTSFTTALTFLDPSIQIVGDTANVLVTESMPLVLNINEPSTSTPIPTLAPTVKPTATPVPTTTASTNYSVKIQNVPNTTTAADLFELNYIQIGDRKYQETSSFLTFSSGWDQGDTSKMTSRTAWVTFDSNEPTITLGTSKGPNRGTIQVYVNNVLKKTITLTQTSAVASAIVISLR